MIKFIQENYLQVSLLIILIGITIYGIVTDNMTMLDKILMAVFAGLNLNQLKK